MVSVGAWGVAAPTEFGGFFIPPVFHNSIHINLSTKECKILKSALQRIPHLGTESESTVKILANLAFCY